MTGKEKKEGERENNILIRGNKMGEKRKGKEREGEEERRGKM